jgi:4,5-dihydroxyphthalate decarboxylase
MMHTIVIRRDVYDAHPWVAQAMFKACSAAQRLAYDTLRDAPALPIMLPFLMSHVEETRSLMGDSWWPYGVEPNRHALETFLRYHHDQGLSPNPITVEAMFAKETFEEATV